MAKSVDDRGRGARMARRDEGAYCRYVTEEQRSQPGWIGREGDRLSLSRALNFARNLRRPRVSDREMSAAVKPSTEGNVAAFLLSVGLHGAVVLLPLLARLHGAPPPPKLDLPNSIAMVGNSIEVEAPTPEFAAAPAAPTPAPETEPVDVKSSPAEPAVALEPAAMAAPPR